MMLLELLKARAVEKGLISPVTTIDAEKAFLLVRDMPYARASDRRPETIIGEWRGTCSGKHYLLKELFTELGYASRIVACTTISHFDPHKYQGRLRELLEQSNGRFVDVHNYLILELPDGDMIVDATLPVSAKSSGSVVNERFVLGEDQKISLEPIQSWDVPEDRDPQEFKNKLLRDNFTPTELKHREEIILTISEMSSST